MLFVTLPLDFFVIVRTIFFAILLALYGVILLNRLSNLVLAIEITVEKLIHDLYDTRAKTDVRAHHWDQFNEEFEK
jgi:hypothetical protein